MTPATGQRTQTHELAAPAGPGPAALLRARSLSALSSTPFDVLVVGGGATGAGVARDATTRGLRVALVEAADFASETSSHSSKLIHGGLRYLQYLDFALVFEALRERRLLMRLAPHLCRPVEFLFPAYRGLAPRLGTLGAGIALYNALALWRAPVARRRLTAREVLDRVPGLDAAGLEGAQTYLDCQTNDARLVLETVLDALAAGATAVPRIEVSGLVRDRRGQVRGAIARDTLSDAELEIQARVVINATGPFSDSFDRGRRNLRPTLGVHIVLDGERVPHDGRAIVLRSPRDGRLVFLLPHGHRTIIGTTDTDWTRGEGSATPNHAARDERPKPGAAISARAIDVEYLLEVANHAFPRAGLAADDVISTFAGLRPLVSAPAHTASSTSREHEVLVEPDGLVTVIGGKLTTFRLMAEQTTDLAVERLRALGFEGAVAPCTTARRPFFAAPERVPGEDHASMGNIELAPDVEAHLRGTYGRLAATVAATSREEVRHLDLSARLYPDLPFIWAEVLHAARRELATSVEDVLRRRLSVFRDARDQGLSVVDDAATLLGAELHWSAPEIARAVEAYKQSVAASRAWRREAPSTGGGA